MKLKDLLAPLTSLRAPHAPERLAYDEVFGRGEAAAGGGCSAIAPRRVPLAADADAYFKDVFAGSAF